jgi:membrane protein YdbS with pleckstrin-like domain
MADQGSRGDGEEPPFFDRDTEPIPRARFQGERGRHAAADESAGNPGADFDPVDPPSASVEIPPDAEPRGRRDRPRPSPRRTGGNGDPPIAPVSPAVGVASPDRGTFDDDDLMPAGGYRGRTASFDDEPTAFQDFPDFDDDPARYGVRQSHVDGSFVVGEPITEEELGGLRGGSTPLVTSRRVVPLEDEASTLVQRYLFPTEKFRGEWRRHPIELAKQVGIAAGVTIAVGLLAGYLSRVDAADEIAGFLVLAWLGVIIWAAWHIVDWWYDRFILTNKRVMVVSGVVTRNVAMMPLQRVTDMKYVQSALGRLLNYGTFELESAGQDQALRSIPHLPSPNELYLRIVEEMYEPEAVEARLAGAQDVIDDGT